MKRNLILLLLPACLVTCTTPDKKKDVAYAEQQYIQVDAKVKIYHKDGTRTYGDYKPFDTRTVELLAGYETPKKLVKKSKYGGNTNLQTDATGFFHVKKIGDRWWGIDPEGYCRPHRPSRPGEATRGRIAGAG